MNRICSTQSTELRMTSFGWSSSPAGVACRVAVALALRVLGGLSVADIASAFLVTESAMAHASLARRRHFGKPTSRSRFPKVRIAPDAFPTSWGSSTSSSTGIFSDIR